ncbi:MAG: glycerophosphodiester phosphodiesterase family protein [Acidimicrobiia bacterium]|nr:glycerophosphodiester phosphodiesterase family protein [Acidimicrobiia bacterium]
MTKKVYEIRLDRADSRGFVTKSLVVDLLYISNPNRIPAQANGGFGLGNPFSFPMQSVETLVPLKGGKLLIANDNNYPGNAVRFPGTPDDTEMIVLAPGRGARGNGGDDHGDGGKPLVIGHRGASGYRPEHTLDSYELAIRSCADYIEPDMVSTRDGVLVARHENEIGGTTDIANHPEFADRKTTKVIDGVSVTGWFTEDLTLAELRTLRARERLPQLRPANATYDGLFQVPTLEEVIQLAQRYRTCDGRPVGIYPETKHPTYFDSVGLSLEEPLLKLLGRYGYDHKSSPVYIQSFETGNLKELAGKTKLPLVQLINCTDRLPRPEHRTPGLRPSNNHAPTRHDASVRTVPSPRTAERRARRPRRPCPGSRAYAHPLVGVAHRPRGPVALAPGAPGQHSGCFVYCTSQRQRYGPGREISILPDAGRIHRPAPVGQTRERRGGSQWLHQPRRGSTASTGRCGPRGRSCRSPSTCTRRPWARSG